MAGNRARCLMPDADVVIHLFKAGLWPAVSAAYQIVLPSIVYGEARFFFDDSGACLPIDLEAEIAAGGVEVLEGSPENLASLQQCFDSVFLEGLHDGEQEALGLVHSGRFADGWFCSGDRKAQVATVALGHEAMVVSLEQALGRIGRSLTQYLRQWRHLTANGVRDSISEGQRMRLTGEGMTSALLDRRGQGRSRRRRG